MIICRPQALKRDGLWTTPEVPLVPRRCLRCHRFFWPLLNMSEERSITVVKHDLAHYTPYQNRLYGAPSKDAEITPLSIFYYDSQKVLAYSSGVTLPLDATRGDKDNIYKYTVSNKFHKLMHVFATITVPKIKVLPEYKSRVQICFCKNLPHNIIKQSTLTISTLEQTFSQTINTYTADAYRARDCINGTLYDYMIGNRDELISWGTHLGTHDELFMPLRFFMDEETHMSLPIHMYPDGVSFKNEYELDLKRLLRMRIKNKKGKWENVIPDLRLLEVDKSNIDTPNIWGEYRMMEYREDENVEVNREYEEEREKGREIHIKDYVHLKQQDVYHSFTYEFFNENSAVLGIRYSFVNCKAALFNNHSNYGLYHDAVHTSIDPQNQFSLSFGTDDRITHRSTIHSTLIPSFYQLRATLSAVDVTIHDILFDANPYRMEPDNTIVFRKTSILTCNLRNEDNSDRNRARVVTDAKLEKSDPDDQLDSILIHTSKLFNKNELDKSISNKFIFKGYLRVSKVITFSVGAITVHE